MSEISLRRALRRVVPAFAAAVVLIAATGCGSDDSKPGYCADKSQLESSIKALPSSVTSGDLSGLQTQAKTVESDAQALVDSAKGEFPSETSAITSSIDSLKSTIEGLGSSPSAADLGQIVSGAGNVASAVKAFASAAGSACD